MTAAGDLFLGDVARAFGVLRPTDADARRLIVQVLGFEVGEAEAQVPIPTGGPRQGEAPAVRVTAELAVDKPQAVPLTTAADSPGPLPQLVGRRDPQLEATRPFWLSNGSRPLPKQDENSIRARPPLEPLFRPAWMRGILSAALATTVEEGTIDIERMVAEIARARPVSTVLLTCVSTLRNGIQIVLDKREAMNPFLRDQMHLVESVRRTVGRELTMVFDMARTPLRVRKEGKTHVWSDYAPPRAGTPVLLVSDLGIGQPMLASDIVLERDWLSFAQLLRRTGCPAIAFVPYPQARWPDKLAAHFRIVTWDRHTSAAAALRAIRGRRRHLW